MSKGKLLIGLFVVLAAATVPAQAAVIVLTFEGLGNEAQVGNFYNGGAGTDYNIDFAESALAVIDQDAGGTGNIGGEPSPSTALFFLDGFAATMNVLDGFDTGFSFFYSAVNDPGFINVWSGLDSTGILLATLALPATPSNGGDPNGDFSPFLATGVTFLGTAMSVDFGGSANQIAFDDITLGSATPGVPEPGSLGLLGLGLAGLAAWRRSRA